MSNEYTRDVIARGVQAVHDRRQAQRYGPLTRSQGIQNYAAGGDVADLTATPQYQQWLDSRGVGAAPSTPPVIGQAMGGKYNGFQTEGMLKNAVAGTAEQLRMTDRGRAQEMQGMIDDRLNDVDRQYQAQQAASVPTHFSTDDATKLNMYARAANPETAAAWKRDAATSETAAAADAKVRQHITYGGPNADPNDPYLAKITAAAAAEHEAVDERSTREGADADYADRLDQWYTQQSNTLLDAQGLAQQIEGTPLRQYAGMAGDRYGVDPALVAGWYPESSDVADARNQRDLESLHTTGLPYSEYQQTLKGVATDQEQADTQQAKDDIAFNKADVDQTVMDATQWNADDLANAADLDPRVLPEIVNSNAFFSVQQQIEDAITEATGEDGNIGDDEAKSLSQLVDEAINSSHQQDPALARIVQAMYGDRLL